MSFYESIRESAKAFIWRPRQRQLNSKYSVLGREYAEADLSDSEQKRRRDRYSSRRARKEEYHSSVFIRQGLVQDYMRQCGVSPFGLYLYIARHAKSETLRVDKLFDNLAFLSKLVDNLGKFIRGGNLAGLPYEEKRTRIKRLALLDVHDTLGVEMGLPKFLQ